MRTITFRGKRVDNGEWIYGDLIHSYIKSDNTLTLLYYIYNSVPNEKHLVSSETVGQFTNLSDWDYGTEIYEDDVVSNGVRNYVIKFLNGCYWLINKDCIACYILSDARCEVRVLGSIHDNPELLTKE